MGELATEPTARGATPRRPGHCRFCGTDLQYTFVDLGMSPLCESYLSADQLEEMEPFYPLHVRVCERCFLVQLDVFVEPEDIFTEYAYFSSYSDSWLEHASAYVDMATERFGLNERSHVVEIGSNDGYLLQYFIRKSIPVLGIEPARNVAKAAEQRNVPTIPLFFSEETARRIVEESGQADLVIGNNVLAQVPDLNSFVAGLKILTKPGGVITLEFPHLARLMEENQFDTIYHEHFSYFSFITARDILAAHDLTVFDVGEIPTHGGSLRVYARHAEERARPISDRVEALLSREERAGLRHIDHYCGFDDCVRRTKRHLLEFLIAAKDDGKSVAGYGAPGKGNTLLNYCGIRTDLLDYTVDRNPYKQGKFLPGTHIPILVPDRIKQTQPDYVFILPWNLRDEVISQMAFIRSWGGRFVVAIPELTVYD